MVDVEEGALGALEEDPGAALELAVEEERGIRDVGAEALAQGEVLGGDLRRLQRGGGDAGVRGEVGELLEGGGEALGDLPVRGRGPGLPRGA